MTFEYNGLYKYILNRELLYVLQNKIPKKLEMNFTFVLLANQHDGNRNRKSDEETVRPHSNESKFNLSRVMSIDAIRSRCCLYSRSRLMVW